MSTKAWRLHSTTPRRLLNSSSSSLSKRIRALTAASAFGREGEAGPFSIETRTIVHNGRISRVAVALRDRDPVLAEELTASAGPLAGRRNAANWEPRLLPPLGGSEVSRGRRRPSRFWRTGGSAACTPPRPASCAARCFSSQRQRVVRLRVGSVSLGDWHLFGRDGRAGVRDGEEGVPVAGSGGDLEVSGGGVVADCVVDQVGDQALERSWIACGRCWVEGGVDVEAQALDVGALSL